MAQRPASPLRWASSNPSGIVVPTNTALQNGFAPAERPPAQWVNWLHNGAALWVDYLRSAHLGQWTRTAWGVTAFDHTAVTTPILAGVDTVTVEGNTKVYRWVTVGSIGGAPKIIASVRGDSWAQRNPTNVNFGTPYALAFASSRWMIGTSDGGTGRIWWSDPSGTVGSLIDTAGAWNAATLPGGTTKVTSIRSALETSKEVACAGMSLLWSLDHTTFNLATLSAANTGVFMDSIWSGTAWVAVTNDGELYRTTTPEGTWTKLGSTVPLGHEWRFAVGESGEILLYPVNDPSPTLDWYRSLDHGATWLVFGDPAVLDDIRSIQRIDGQWVMVVGAVPYLAIANTLDGPWVHAPVPLPEGALYEIADVVYGEGQALAVGVGFTLASGRARDLDGGAWVPSSASMPLMDAAYLRGRLIDATAPTNGQALVWDSGSSQWKPTTLPFVRADGTVPLTADWNVGSKKITNLATPTASGDATTKGYVDGVVTPPAPIADLLNNFATLNSTGGDFTVGSTFITKRALTCIGVRFYWAGGAATVKVSLWPNSGALLETVNVAVGGAGFYDATFGSPVALATATRYRVSMYESSAYTSASAAPAEMPVVPFDSASVLYFSIKSYVAGDANPTSIGSDAYPVHPRFG